MIYNIDSAEQLENMLTKKEISLYKEKDFEGFFESLDLGSQQILLYLLGGASNKTDLKMASLPCWVDIDKFIQCFTQNGILLHEPTNDLYAINSEFAAWLNEKSIYDQIPSLITLLPEGMHSPEVDTYLQIKQIAIALIPHRDQGQIAKNAIAIHEAILGYVSQKDLGQN